MLRKWIKVKTSKHDFVLHYHHIFSLLANLVMICGIPFQNTNITLIQSTTISRLRTYIKGFIDKDCVYFLFYFKCFWMMKLISFHANRMFCKDFLDKLILKNFALSSFEIIFKNLNFYYDILFYYKVKVHAQLVLMDPNMHLNSHKHICKS